MNIFNTISLESNSQIKINFDGGDLSSNAGVLLFKEFLFKIGAARFINRMFKTNGFHKDVANLMQAIYQLIIAYFEDDCADELTNDPFMTSILNKDTPSHFFNRMDAHTLEQLDKITHQLHKVVYSIKKPAFMPFDIDFTLLDTYDHQEGEGFNYHYKAHSYHPLLCYDGLTGDLLKAELCDGTIYCNKEADIFIKSLLHEFIADIPDIPLYFRGEGQMIHMYTFASVSSSYRLIKADDLLIHGLAYNLFNWFRRLVLAVSMRKQHINTIHL